MQDLDERLRAAKARNELAVFDDDTAIEEDLAALYLCVSAKKLGELRGNGGGPEFVKPQDPRAAGRNQPVSYIMRELRKWRKSMSAGSNLEVARRQGLVAWVSSEEPFWIMKTDLIVNSAIDQSGHDWPDLFLQAISGEILVRWLPPQKALEMAWKNLGIQEKFGDGFIEMLDDAKCRVQAALARSTVMQMILDAGMGSVTDQ